MNYLKLYHKIIDEGKSRIIKSGHKHHIIPLCIDGADEEWNLVVLTPKEHYICHLLLTKIYPNNQKLKNAFLLMKNTLKGNIKRKKRSKGHCYVVCNIYNPLNNIQVFKTKDEVSAFIGVKNISNKPKFYNTSFYVKRFDL